MLLQIEAGRVSSFLLTYRDRQPETEGWIVAVHKRSWHLRALVAKYLNREGLLLALALLVGLGAGLGAILFRWLIGVVRWISFEWLPDVTAGWGAAYVVIAPTIGGLLVGPLIYFFAREAKGHGVPEVMEAVALRGGRIRPVVALVKSIASSLSIGTGGSVGREGPIVQIGSTIGSTVGQAMKMSDDRVRNLVACGAAGGVAATFNAPIAGVIFALEVILGNFSAKSFGTVVIASVTASVVGRAAFGDVPAFVVPEYTLNSIWEFPLYLVLGIAAALVGALYTRALYGGEDLFDAWKKVPEWSKAGIGGLLLGCMALAYGAIPGLGFDVVPQVYGVGYETIESGLLGNNVMLAMLALVGLKILATSITIGSGGSGGVFAPSLFIGSMLGGSLGLLFAQLVPGVPGPPGAYALVGMGAVFAGATQASMTAVLIIFEMTGDYKIILPLMLAVVTATLLSGVLLKGETIYTLKLTRRGVRLKRGRALDVLEAVQVEEVMSETVTVLPETPLEGLDEFFLKANRNAFPVVDDGGKLIGIVSLTDVRRALESRDDIRDLCVREIMTDTLVTAFPDESLNAVLQRMAPRDLSLLPVVSRDHPDRRLGVIRRNDVVRAYDLGLARRELDAPEAPPGIRRTGHVDYIEVDLPSDSHCVGRSVAEISSELPKDSLLVSIRRVDGSVVFPRGDTVLQVGDRIVAYARKDRLEELRRCLRAPA
jgi:CIC family chloride channel protein